MISKISSTKSRPKYLKFLPILLILLVVGFVGFRIFQNLSANPQQTLVAASKNFSELDYVHIEGSIDTFVEGTKLLDIKGSFDVNFKDNLQKVRMNFGASGVTAEMDMILLTDDFYFKAPFLHPDWIHSEVDTLLSQGSLPYDPREFDFVDQFRAFTQSFDQETAESLGDEEVDGKRASHYKVKINKVEFEKYLEDNFENGGRYFETYKDADITSELWIDRSNNQILRMLIRFKGLELIEPTDGSSLGSADTTADMKFSKFNERVDINKPEGKIVEYEDVIAQ